MEKDRFEFGGCKQLFSQQCQESLLGLKDFRIRDVTEEKPGRTMIPPILKSTTRFPINNTSDGEQIQIHHCTGT